MLHGHFAEAAACHRAWARQWSFWHASWPTASKDLACLWSWYVATALSFLLLKRYILMFIPASRRPRFSNRSWSVHSIPEVLFILASAHMGVYTPVPLQEALSISGVPYALRSILRQAEDAAMGEQNDVAGCSRRTT